jgi:hypothetical protein
MHLEYGDEAALSERQRHDYQQQCLSAVREVLSPERFNAYLAIVNASHRRAGAAREK